MSIWRKSSVSFLTGIVPDFGSLPLPPGDYELQMFLVENSSGGFLSSIGIYKYPKGIYTPNSSLTAWELVPLNVTVAEDSTTLVNISNWTEFFNFSFNIQIGDRLLYNGVEYKNISGVLTITPPETDLTNWEKTFPENTITVAKSGGDFTSIKSAIDSVSGGVRTTILIYPGLYIENNPIQGKAELTIKAVGGQNTVEIRAQNPNQNMFNAVGSFFIEDINIQNVSGASNYAIEMINTGSVLISNVLFENCQNGIHLNNSGGQINLRNAAFQGSMDICIKVESGNLLETSIGIVGTASINTIVNIIGINSIATLNNIVSFSPNVITGIFIQDQARVVSNACSMAFMDNGVVLEGGCNFRANSLVIFSAKQDGIRVNNVGSNTFWSCNSCTIENSTNYDINILSPTAFSIGTGTTSIDKLNFVSGAELYGILIDSKENDEGVNIIGELHVGIPEKGSESAFGGGDSYTRGMLVYTETDLGVFTDVSIEAASASGSTFTFPGVSTNNSIYVASTLENTTDVLEHYGLKTDVITAAIKGGGSIIIEYWNGSVWAEIKGMEVDSSGSYYPYADNYFSKIGGFQIRYNLNLSKDSWSKNDPMGLGTSFYWIRFRISNTITLSPVFEQFKLHTDRSELNADGWLEYFGKARPLGQLPFAIGQDKALEGNLGNQSVYINQNIGAGLNENNFNSDSDKIGRFFFIPLDLDTSTPIDLKIAGRPSGNGTITFTVRWDNKTEGDIAYLTEPSLLPGSKSISQTKSVIAGEITFFNFILDVSNVISRREIGEPDFIGMTIHSSSLGGLSFTLMAIEANYIKWCEGGHI